MLTTMTERLNQLPAVSFTAGRARFTGDLGDVDKLLDDAKRDVAAARGGDADAAQKARRTLQELDARLDRAERESSWPELESQAMETYSSATRWVSQYGTPVEQRYLAEAGEALDRARRTRDVAELQRQLRLVNNLSSAAYHRAPDSHRWSFERAASRISEASDLPKAQQLVARGRAALDAGDVPTVRSITEQLWRLLPSDPSNRRASHDSGVRG